MKHPGPFHERKWEGGEKGEGRESMKGGKDEWEMGSFSFQSTDRK